MDWQSPPASGSPTPPAAGVPDRTPNACAPCPHCEEIKQSEAKKRKKNQSQFSSKKFLKNWMTFPLFLFCFIFTRNTVHFAKNHWYFKQLFAVRGSRVVSPAHEWPTGWGAGWRWRDWAVLIEVENHRRYLPGSLHGKTARGRGLTCLKGRGWDGSLFQLLIWLDGYFTNMPKERGFKRGRREQQRLPWLI